VIALLAPLLLRIGIPARLHRWAVYAALALLTIALIAVWFARHDARVIERHENKREAAAAGATVKSAEERAVDALANQMSRDQREAAIAVAEASEVAKAPEARATVAPQNRALNCARLKQAGLTGDAAYRAACM
jgi:hypothetical protein